MMNTAGNLIITSDLSIYTSVMYCTMYVCMYVFPVVSLGFYYTLLFELGFTTFSCYFNLVVMISSTNYTLTYVTIYYCCT